MVKECIHSRSHHPDVNQNPAKRQSNPAFLEVQRQSVKDQACGHATDREPHAVETILGSPLRAAGSEDPIVEEVAKDKAWHLVSGSICHIA